MYQSGQAALLAIAVVALWYGVIIAYYYIITQFHTPTEESGMPKADFTVLLWAIACFLVVWGAIYLSKKLKQKYAR